MSEYDLTFKRFDNGRRNIYYNYNQQTQLKKFIDLITQFIKQIQTKGLKFNKSAAYSRFGNRLAEGITIGCKSISAIVPATTL